MKKLHLFLILILSVYTHAYSQEREYIIMNSNDTIYGKVTRAASFWKPQIMRYKIRTENGEKFLIDPSKVKMLRSFDGVDGDCVIATVYDEWYVKRILTGRIEVYCLVDGVLFYTSKDGSELTYADFGGFTSRKKSHANIRPLLADDPEILKEYDTLSGSQRNIMYIIEKYNEKAE